MVDQITAVKSPTQLPQEPVQKPEKLQVQSTTQPANQDHTLQIARTEKEAELQATHLREAYIVHISTTAKVEALKLQGSSVDSIAASLSLSKTDVNSTLEITDAAATATANAETAAVLL